MKRVKFLEKFGFKAKSSYFFNHLFKYASLYVNDNTDNNDYDNNNDNHYCNDNINDSDNSCNKILKPDWLLPAMIVVFTVYASFPSDRTLSSITCILHRAVAFESVDSSLFVNY